MTDAEFGSRYERLGVVVQGSGVATQFVRDQARVLHMAHLLGANGGAGTVRLNALYRLSPEAQAEIVERCLVDGNWVLITRNLDGFVDFEHWVSAKETPMDVFATDVFGPRLDREPGPGPVQRPSKEPPPKATRPPVDPHATQLFGPQVDEPAPPRPKHRDGPAREASERDPESKERPAEAAVSPSLTSAPGARGARPRVFWRDLEGRSFQPSPVEPGDLSVPAVAALSPMAQPEVPDAPPEEEAQPDSGPSYPAPLPPSWIQDRPAEPKGVPLQMRTLLQSMPRIPLPGRRSGGEKFTQIISGRPQGGVDAQPGAESAQGEDEGSGIPKWLIIAMAVIAVIAVILIVIGFLT